MYHMHAEAAREMLLIDGTLRVDIFSKVPRPEL